MRSDATENMLSTQAIRDIAEGTREFQLEGSCQRYSANLADICVDRVRAVPPLNTTNGQTMNVSGIMEAFEAAFAECRL